MPVRRISLPTTISTYVTLIAVLAEAPHDFLFFWRMRAWTDFAQMTGTFFLTLCFSIEVRIPELRLHSRTLTFA